MSRGAITGDRTRVPLIILVQGSLINDAWCIATSDRSLTGAEVKRQYGKSFSCEEMFRDFKDLRYGWGLSWSHIGTTERRDSLFLLAAMAFVLLILLGAANGAPRPRRTPCSVVNCNRTSRCRSLY